MNSVAVIAAGAVGVFLFFFLLLWAADRQPRRAAQTAGIITLNFCTAILAASLLSEMTPFLRRADEAIFWLIGIIWTLAALGAVYAPWHFFRPR